MGTKRRREEKVSARDESGPTDEKRDHQLGRCLAFRAIIQSKALHGRAAADGVPALNQLLDHVFDLYKQAPFIRQECGTTANSVVSTARFTQSPAPAYATALLHAYHKHGISKTSEGLAAWLDAQSLFPESLDLPAGVWQKDDPLHPQERSTLVKILRDNLNETGSETASVPLSTGQAQKIPCAAWLPTLTAVADRTKLAGTEKTDTAFFVQFWKEAVDDAFFSAKASSERKAIGLQVVRLAIARLDTSLVGEVLSPHVVRCIINQRSSPSNSLHTAVEVPLKALCQRSKQDPEVAAIFLRAIIDKSGLPNFDRLTRTKTIDELLSHVAAEDVEQILDIVDNTICRPKTSEHTDAEVSQRSCADLLLALARKQHPAITANRTGPRASNLVTSNGTTSIFPWTKLFSLLAQHAYLIKKGTEPLLPAIQEVYQARTMSCLTHTLDAGLDPDFDHATHVVTTIKKLTKSGKHDLVLKADPAVLNILATGSTRLQAVKKSLTTASDKDRPTLQAFKLLFSLSILQVYNGDPDAVSILEELEECYETLSKSKNAISLLVEILLGFLSRPSALFRKLAEQVFAAISPQVHEDGLNTLLEILEKPENMSGQQELFENADEVAEMVVDGSEASSAGDSSDDLEASDVEMIEASDNDEADDSSDAEDASEDDDSFTESSDGDKVSQPDDELTAFESKLAQTLGTSKIASHGNADDETSDESDMDDDQMMELDGHLTKIFQERTKESSKKKDNKDAKGNVINFKSRVLDLLAVFVKQCYSRSVVLSTITPLLQLVRTTTNKELSSRAFNTLKALFDTCAKHKTFPDSFADDMFAVLSGVHQELAQSNSKIHASAASRSSLFIVKAAALQDRAHYSRAVDMYSALQKSWYADPRSKIPAAAFTEWTSWSINSRK
ncbi:DNA polymerase phi-like protein [Elsinoe fawcettii]|nr:DNA polymerase phi-like protein [Elsinoe fawcettii]